MYNRIISKFLNVSLDNRLKLRIKNHLFFVKEKVCFRLYHECARLRYVEILNNLRVGKFMKIYGLRIFLHFYPYQRSTGGETYKIR